MPKPDTTKSNSRQALLAGDPRLLAEAYQYIVNNTRDLISYVNRDYVYVIVNDAYVNVYGRPRRAMVGRHVAAIWGQAKFDAMLRRRFDECLSGRPVKDQSWIDCGHLGERFMDIAYHPYLRAGRVQAAIVISHDITELKVAKDELQKREEHFRLLVDNSVDLILSLDPLGQIVYLNPVAKLMLSPEKSLFDQIHPSDHEKWQHCLDQLQCRENVRNQELKVVDLGGVLRYLSLTATPVRNAHDLLTGYTIIARDLTHERRFETISREMGLSSRELEILRWVAQGYTNLNIAKRLNVQESTIKFHVNRIFKKTHTQNRTELVALLHSL